MGLWDDVRALDEHMFAQRNEPPQPPPPLLLPTWAADIPPLAELAADNPTQVVISEPIPIERPFE